MRETFFLDGVDASSVGIQLQRPIEFSDPVPIVETDEIDGRNGELIYETGAYENRTARAHCFVLQQGVSGALSAANRFLLSNHGYRKLETSDSPETYWMARVENGARIEQRARILAPCEVRFSCKPQRFLKSGDDEIVFDKYGVIYNQYFHTAKPFVTIYGSGAGRAYIGGKVVDIIDMDGWLYLDSETMNVYNENGNQNRNVRVDEFPSLVDGENIIDCEGGVTSVSIKPRWWVL